MLTKSETDQLIEIAQRAGITYLGVFGSVARGDAVQGSDVDLAVRFGRSVTLFDLIGVKLEMEAVLGHPVDLIPLDSAYNFIRESIARDVTVLYEEPVQVTKSTSYNN